MATAISFISFPPLVGILVILFVRVSWQFSWHATQSPNTSLWLAKRLSIWCKFRTNSHVWLKWTKVESFPIYVYSNSMCVSVCVLIDKLSDLHSLNCNETRNTIIQGNYLINNMRIWNTCSYAHLYSCLLAFILLQKSLSNSTRNNLQRSKY